MRGGLIQLHSVLDYDVLRYLNMAGPAQNKRAKQCGRNTLQQFYISIHALKEQPLVQYKREISLPQCSTAFC